MNRIADAALTVGRSLILRFLRAEISRMRGAGVPVGEDEYRGLYVSDIEADRLLGAAGGAGGWGDPDLDACRQELTALTRCSEGRLGRLVQALHLTSFELGVLLLCFVSEVELEFERLIAYVQDDVSKRRPRIELALRLFCRGEDDQTAGLGALHAAAPLRRLGMIALHDEPGQPHTPVRAQYMALERRVAAFLCGLDDLDEALQPYADLHPDARSSPALDPGLLEVLQPLALLPATALTPAAVELTGTDSALLRAAAWRLAEGAGLQLLVVQLNRLAADSDVESALRLARRESLLQPAALCLAGIEVLRPEERAQVFDAFRDDPVVPLVIFAHSGTPGWPGVAAEVPPLDFEARRARWGASLGTRLAVPDADLDAIAGKFRLSSRAIEEASRAAMGLAVLRGPADPVIRTEDLYAAAKTQSTPILNTLARKVTPHYEWADIVLPHDTLAQLREMCAQVEHRHLVFDVWGFDRKLALGKGVIALFAGPSGTGKTMAAEIVANALRLDLYKIDLSGVVSKYIGETEKNLSSIFSEAETSNAILFFDEADALFGKRSEVKDAHDRYANIETAYLLQRMEEYAGPVILATNLKMNLDEAFLRRLHFVIDFPMPEEDERLRIWKSTIPAAAPLSGDIDFAFLARQFRISGGNIRNIVLTAAFLAADENRPIGMSHLVAGTRREFQKLSRMVTEAEFGDYVSQFRRPGTPGQP